MKCIQAVKASKYSEIGEIRRVDNIDAQEKVTGGYWKFIPKSEWKLATRKQKEEVKEIQPANVEDGQTISEKQLSRKKTKK